MHTDTSTSRHLWYTLGPASLGREVDLFQRGATGVRLTFNFGTPELQLERARTIKRSLEPLSIPSLMLADLGGEKFRLGGFEGEETIAIPAGTLVRLMVARSGEVSSQPLALPVPDPTFFSMLSVGATIVVGDGTGTFRVLRCDRQGAEVETILDSTVNQHRGLTIQGGDFKPQSLTDKDLSDLTHILEFDCYDAVALSFVSSPEDVARAREVAHKSGRGNIPIVSKIETALGVINARQIAQSSDMIMVGRGDLALAMPWVELPGAVRTIVSAANSAGVPWIQATQIVEGLERSCMPSRAEICDLAAWMQLGCSGALLSYETVFGKQASEAVSCTAALMRRWG